NLCNRSQNVIGCCPGANIDACLQDFNTNNFTSYYNDCQCGAPISGVQHSDCDTNYALRATLGPCTAGACASAPSSIKCTSGSCTAGDPTRIGLPCSINNDCGTPVTVATCQACPELGDRNNGTFGCADIFNPPVCKPGHFPAQAVGTCDGSAS